jgi:hypothetical protein
MAEQKIPPIGATVVTSDGEVVGTVAALVEPCFKIDKPMRPDQWIGQDVIASTSGDEVRLSITRDQLQGEPEGIEHFGFHVHRDR